MLQCIKIISAVTARRDQFSKIQTHKNEFKKIGVGYLYIGYVECSIFNLLIKTYTFIPVFL